VGKKEKDGLREYIEKEARSTEGIPNKEVK
jgi:hypothetical protein